MALRFSFLLKFLIQILLDGLESIIIDLLPLDIVFQSQLDGVAQLHIFLDQPKRQLQDLHIV